MALEVRFIFDEKIHLQVFIDQIFRIFDKDGGGTIDFRVWDFFVEMLAIYVLGVHDGHRHDNVRIS